MDPFFHFGSFFPFPSCGAFFCKDDRTANWLAKSWAGAEPGGKEECIDVRSRLENEVAMGKLQYIRQHVWDKHRSMHEHVFPFLRSNSRRWEPLLQIHPDSCLV